MHPDRRRAGPGGSRWHNESRIAAISTELTYEPTELRSDGMVFVGTEEQMTQVLDRLAG